MKYIQNRIYRHYIVFDFGKQYNQMKPICYLHFIGYRAFGILC